jgi:ATP-binding cassette subfamily C (CFTR/MRP) protein 1
VLATHDENYAQFADHLLVLDTNGCPAFSGPLGKWKGMAVTVDDHDADEEPDSQGYQISTVSSNKSDQRSYNETTMDPQEVEDPSKSPRQTGDIITWIYYAKAVGIIPLILFGILIVLAVLGSNFPKLLLKWSTEEHFTVGKFIGLYALMIMISWTCQIAMLAQMMIVIATKSIVNLHKILVEATLQAPLSFFATTDSSLLLNRFSQDMTMVDMLLPGSIFALILSLSMCLVELAFVCIGSQYMAVTVPITLVAVYCIQKFYLRTSRQMRLLDLECKSPLYKQFTETIEGISTIRAFGWQRHFDSTALQALDDSQKPYYLLYCIQRWLNLVLDLTTACMGTCVVALALCVPQSSTPGSLGVALTSILSFNSSLQGLISAYAVAEQVLGSVTRTRSFEKETPRENADEDGLSDPGPEWPQGDVRVSDLSVYYKDDVPALQNVTFEVLLAKNAVSLEEQEVVKAQQCRPC